MKMLHLDRTEDVSGVSGTGRVAEGVQFDDGTIVLQWNTKVSSLVIYKNIADLVTIVSHGGKTRVVLDDA